MKTYIVTGATGFVGNNLVRELTKRGNRVIAMARCEKKLQKTLEGLDVEVVFGTVMNPDDIEKMFEIAGKNVVVVHTAAMVNLGRNKQQLRQMYETNVIGTQNVIDACVRHGAQLVYVSSVYAIPPGKKGSTITEIQQFNPSSVRGGYAKSKAEASRLVMEAVEQHGLKAQIVHPSGIVGPNDYSATYILQIIDNYKAGRIPVSVTGGYDFVDVRDVVNGIIAAADKAVAGGCYLLTGQYVSVSEVLDILHELGIGKKVKRKVPIWVARVGLPLLTTHARITKKKPLYTKDSLLALSANSNFSHKLATKELNYNPRNIRESLKDMI